MLYLHEIIDIIGDGQQPYLDTVAERARHSECEGISRLMGTFKVVGSTNRWPRVVNLWEMDGWGNWATSLERQFLPENQDPHLRPWWSKATQWRSGGFDRILEPAPYSPTREALQAQKFTAWVCVHTITRLTPGAQQAYLQMFGDVLRPTLEARGLILMGAFAAAMRSDEVVTLWGASGFRALCGLYEQRHQDVELQDWTTRVASLRQQVETMWLVPSEECFFHPRSRQPE